MKTHRIILPATQHAAALRGVDRLLLPMRDRHIVYEKNGLIREAVSPYVTGDRLALLEPWATRSDLPRPVFRADYRSAEFPYGHIYDETTKWKPASRIPLSACRCFYRVLSVEPVRDGDTWKWIVKVERI